MDQVPTLQMLCLRAKSLSLFQTFLKRNVKIEVLPTMAKRFVSANDIPVELRGPMQDSLKTAVDELQRWMAKHSELFPENRKARRSQHLCLYYDCIEWDAKTVRIDDLKTALNIIKQNDNWPQLQFQFACAYALEEMLTSDHFDRVYFRVFRTRLADHPCFDLWNIILNVEAKKNPSEADVFDYMGLTPRQVVVAAWNWAMQWGYAELVNYIWFHVGVAQREYLGMIQWRKLCSRNKVNPVLFTFLANQLYDVNPNNIARITGQIFLTKLKRILQEKPKLSAKLREKEDRFVPIRFLLDLSPMGLRSHLLCQDGYFPFLLAANYKDLESLRFLCPQLESTQKRHLFKKIQCELDPRYCDRLLPIIMQD